MLCFIEFDVVNNFVFWFVVKDVVFELFLFFFIGFFFFGKIGEEEWLLVENFINVFFVLLIVKVIFEGDDLFCWFLNWDFWRSLVLGGFFFTVLEFVVKILKFEILELFVDGRFFTMLIGLLFWILLFILLVWSFKLLFFKEIVLRVEFILELL